MSYKWHVGELKPIQWFANPEPPEAPAANPVSLAGLTVEMKWQDAAGGAHSVAMNVAGDGLSASYTTVAGDLPVAWRLQIPVLCLHRHRRSAADGKRYRPRNSRPGTKLTMDILQTSANLPAERRPRRFGVAILLLAPIVIEVGALAALAYGCFLAWTPLGFIVPGGIILALSIYADLRRSGEMPGAEKQ